MTSRRSAALGCAIGLLLAASPAAADRLASPAPSPLTERRLHERLPQVDVEAAEATVSSLRAAAASGSLEALLRASARVPAGGSMGPAIAGARLPIGGPFGRATERLLQAVRDAEAVTRTATRHGDADLLADVLSLDTRDPRALARLAPRARRIDVRAMTVAAARIAGAVDELLASAPAPAPSPGPPDAGCDVLQVAPVLCVGGAGPNTYATDFGLSIDLGGDDLYTNGGGAGACLGGSIFSQRCVSVVVDLGGDDVHAPPATWNCGSATCGQGAGSLGIGMLVDAEGDDEYRTRGTVGEGAGACLSTRWCGSIAAQGAGGLGVGVLADLAGNDTYLAAFEERALGPDGFEGAQAIVAHGAGILGAGLLWDAGGDDDYEMRVHSTGHLDEPAPGVQGYEWSIAGASGMVGQGAGLAGPGTLLDSGGNDRIAALAAPAAGAEAPSPRAPGGQGGGAGALVQGFGEAFAHESWAGAILTGRGDTEYVADLSARLAVFLQAQGTGRFGAAAGLIDDLGGNDRYDIAVATDVEVSSRCSCPEATAVLDDMKEPFTNHFGLARPTALGQGGPMGFLRDRAGNDVYRATARSTVTLSAVNTRPGGRARAGAVLVGETELLAQGVPGPLRDDGGDDRYLIRADRTVSASASAAAAPGDQPDEDAWAFPGYVQAIGQGVGAGDRSELEDRGGLDTYEARFTGSGSAVPSHPGKESDGPFYVGAHGVDGLMTDVDGGQGDAFHADSPLVFDTCVGRYGQGPGWVSGPTLRDGTCSPTWGSTVASSTGPPGTEPRVSFTSWRPIEDEEFPAVEVEVLLTDAAGAPLPGRRLVMVSEFGYVDPDPLVNQLFPWVDPTLSSAELVTGADGVARGTLPLRLLLCPSGCSGLTGEARLRAIFFGEAGVHRPAQGFVKIAEPWGG